MKTNFSPDNLESDLCWHTFSLPSSCQGETLFCGSAEPTMPFRAVVQISHGMCEHIDRYLPFFRFLAREGFVICGHDHLGHGKSCQDPSVWDSSPPKTVITIWWRTCTPSPFT